MSRSVLIGLLMVLVLIGIADSAYLAESAITDTPLVCDIEGLDDCNVVAQSPYSKLFGIPLGTYGVIFYGIALIVLLGISLAPRRLWFTGFVVLSSFGAFASLVFLGIQFFLIKATCLYCLLSALITFAMVPLSLTLRRRFAPQLPAVVP